MEDILKKITQQTVRSNQATRSRYRNLIDQYRLGTPLRIFSTPLNPFPLFADFFLIAECKKASPSKSIIRSPFDPVAIAEAYIAGGAQAISVLVEENFFQGSETFLRAVREKVSVPVLWKDFVIDEIQVLRAFYSGADMVLLIARLFENNLEQYYKLIDLITELEMTPLLEVFNVEEINMTMDLIDHRLPSQRHKVVLGVNNRDLTTFEVDLNKSKEAKIFLEKKSWNIPLISESGITSHQEILFLKQHGFVGALVGESLLRQSNLERATRSLLADE